VLSARASRSSARRLRKVTVDTRQGFLSQKSACKGPERQKRVLNEKNKMNRFFSLFLLSLPFALVKETSPLLVVGICVCIYVCMYVCMYIYLLYVYILIVCMYVCMYVCTYITYIHI
jgi:hypothetical protein